MDKYHFFWGGVYSNWYKSSFKITIDNNIMTFNCVEQYMMFVKAKLFGDEESATKILETENPKKQKLIGRNVKNFDPKKWGDVKAHLVYLGLCEKFRQNENLKHKIINESCYNFAEASPDDRVWGIGFKQADALEHESEWGENLLGKLLDQVRSTLENEEF